MPTECATGARRAAVTHFFEKASAMHDVCPVTYLFQCYWQLQIDDLPFLLKLQVALAV